MQKLIRYAGFLPFILMAFINAFVDSGHKIIIQNTLFKAYDGELQILLTAIVNGLILLPFILLFTPCGFVADKYPKNRVMRQAAVAAVAVCLLITFCYYQGWFIVAFGLTFLIAVQSAFYSPAKYGYIKELLGVDNLSEGNGWVQAASMVAILSGIVVFSLMFELRLEGAEQMTPEQSLQRVAPLGWVLVAGSLIELALAWRLPQTQEVNQASRFDWQAYRRGKTLSANLSLIFSHRPIWLSIIGLSIFWSISQVMLAVFPAFAETHLDQHNTFVIQGVMALAGIGIMIGSMLAGRWSRHHINLGLIPLGAGGVAIGLILLPQLDSMALQGLVFLGIGLSGALMNVPLNALIQFHADENETGRVLAGNNFIQNIAMFSFLVLTVVCAYLGVDSLWLLILLAMIAVGGTLLALNTVPQAFVRLLVLSLLKRKYRLQVLGFENLPEDGKGTLLLGNHVSWLDWAILQMACPRHIHFVMDKEIYNRWYLNWFMRRYGVIPISGGQSRGALDQVRELLNQGKVVCLFPEGAISYTGQVAEFKKGFEKACQGASGVVVPFYLRGLWGSRFSRSSERLKTLRAGGMKRDVIAAFGKPMPIESTAAEVKKQVLELSIHAWEEHTRTLEPLAAAFIRTAKAAPTEWAITDVKGEPLTHRRLLTACALFARRIRKTPGQNLGLLMPTASAGCIANMAGLMAGRTLVNINFTASLECQLSALQQAEVETIVTARQFVSKLATRGIDVEPLFANRTVLFMEDIKAGITKPEALTTLALIALLPTRLVSAWLCHRVDLEDPAAILFSSGSEGEPKGVLLSHRNMIGNLKQTADVLNVHEQERIMATLPLFHAFGLTVTCMLPLIEGIQVICHPDPTDAFNIGRGVARYQATLMCATSTFLRLYTRNRKLHPLMLSSLGRVVAGAEKLDPQVRKAFESRFKVPILEGYGCTETTPVAGVNLPDYLVPETLTVQIGSREGTVGMALPGSTFRIVDPDTLEELPTGEDGLILIGGTQIMLGYLNQPEKTSAAIIELDGLRWYKSGDKGHLDEEGFLTIIDRYSRFAKLGGEMISLGAVERKVREILEQPERPLVAINLPDERKGEKVVLLMQAEGDTDADRLRSQLVERGMPPLMLPAQILLMDSVPYLGSGKPDFSGARQVVEEQLK